MELCGIEQAVGARVCGEDVGGKLLRVAREGQLTLGGERHGKHAGGQCFNLLIHVVEC